MGQHEQHEGQGDGAETRTDQAATPAGDEGQAATEAPDHSTDSASEKRDQPTE